MEEARHRRGVDPVINILNGPVIDGTVIAAFVSSLIFIIGYTVMAPWWRYAVGRAMVTLDLAISLTILPGILHLAFGLSTATSEFFAWYRVISLGAVAATTLWRLYTVHKVQGSGALERPGTADKESE